MKKPYTKEEFNAIVVKAEQRLGVHLFFSPVIVSHVATHKSDSMRSLNQKLDEIIARSEQALADLQNSQENIEVSEINYIG